MFDRLTETWMRALVMPRPLAFGLSPGAMAQDGPGTCEWCEALEPRVLLSGAPGTAEFESLQAELLASLTTTGSDAPISVADDGGAVSLGTAGRIPLIPPTGLEGAAGLLIGMDRFRADPRFSSITGGGYSTVVIDTGIDLDHPFFGADANANGIADRIVFQHDFGDNDADASDVNGHGSNVASAAASQHGTYPGVAPWAKIIALKVFRDTGAGSFSMVERALQWVVANVSRYNIASVNMSLGDSQNHTAAQRLYGLGDELAALAALNVITVSAAGNSFAGFGGAPGVAYPAADPHSLGVGAVYHSAAGAVSYGSGARAHSRGPDRITPFSQRHGSMTEVFAPGGSIVGANQHGGIVTMDGTSQASPHVAGAAVLAQQLAMRTLGRRLALVEFEALLATTGDVIVDGDDESDSVANTGGRFKRLDVMAMAERILTLGSSPMMNRRPTLWSMDTLSGGVAGAPKTITWSNLAAAGNAADADGDFVGFVVRAVSSGSLTKDGVAARSNVTVIRMGERLVWTPAWNAAGPVGAFTVSAIDYRFAPALNVVGVNVLVSGVAAPGTAAAAGGVVGGSGVGAGPRAAWLGVASAEDVAPVSTVPAVAGSGFDERTAAIWMPAWLRLEAISGAGRVRATWIMPDASAAAEKVSYEFQLVSELGVLPTS